MRANVRAVHEDDDDKMLWWNNAKLGMFTHYGIYCVDGIVESWSFFNHYITYKDYMKQLLGFKAEKWSADEWAELFKAGGAKYAVMTSKHHDGVSLFKGDTWKGLNTVDDTPSKKDFMAEYVPAMRKAGIEPGVYFSLMDWSQPDFDLFESGVNRYDIHQDPARWQKFIDFMTAQLKDLSDKYDPPIFWFDGSWPHNQHDWHCDDIYKMLSKKNPKVICNDRLFGHGDYGAPEQGVPVHRPGSKYWELCMTCNDSWGWQACDTNYKAPNTVITIFIECLYLGGNLLLDCGPKGSGEIEKPQQDIVRGLGRWAQKYAAAVYNSREGIPEDHCIYRTTKTIEGTSLFIIVNQKDVTRDILVAGLEGDIIGVTLHTPRTPLKYTYKDKVLAITPPPAGEQYWDQDATVIQVDFSKPFSIDDKVKLNSKAMVDEFMKDAEWKERHEWFLKNSIDGVSTTYFWGGYTRLSGDKKTLFCIMPGKATGPVHLKGIWSTIDRMFVYGNSLYPEWNLKMTWNNPGIICVDFPDFGYDPSGVTVLAIVFKEPIHLAQLSDTPEQMAAFARQRDAAATRAPPRLPALTMKEAVAVDIPPTHPAKAAAGEVAVPERARSSRLWKVWLFLVHIFMVAAWVYVMFLHM